MHIEFLPDDENYYIIFHDVRQVEKSIFFDFFRLDDYGILFIKYLLTDTVPAVIIQEMILYILVGDMLDDII